MDRTSASASDTKTNPRVTVPAAYQVQPKLAEASDMISYLEQTYGELHSEVA